MVALICEQLALQRRRARARRRHGLRLPGRGARRAGRGGAHDRADPGARGRQRARISRRRATRSASTFTSATGRAAFPSTRRSPRSPSPPRRSRRRPRSTSSSSRAAGSSSRWAAPAASCSRSSCGRRRARPCAAHRSLPLRPAASQVGAEAADCGRRRVGQELLQLPVSSTASDSAGASTSCSTDEWRALGFVVLCGDDALRFLVVPRRRRAGGRDRSVARRSCCSRTSTSTGSAVALARATSARRVRPERLPSRAVVERPAGTLPRRRYRGCAGASLRSVRNWEQLGKFCVVGAAGYSSTSPSTTGCSTPGSTTSRRQRARSSSR